MLRLVRRRFLTCFVVIALLAAARGARAEDDLQVVEGYRECKQMNEAADRDTQAWRKTQPPQLYPDPRPNTVFGAPGFADVLTGFGNVPLELWLATFIPHLGAVMRGGEPAFSISLPWQFPLGPTLTCSKRAGGFQVMNHKPVRLVLEPGIHAGDRLFTAWTRLGARYIHQSAGWVVGLGGGAGSTIQFVGKNEALRASIAPEAVIRFGRCCEHGNFTVAIRFDHYFERQHPDQLLINLGYTYF